MPSRKQHREATIFVAIIILVTALMLLFKYWLPPFM